MMRLKTRFPRLGALTLGVSILFGGIGCKPNPRIVNSARTPEPSQTDRPAPAGFEADLEAMRTADFTYIYVFRRKDGGELDNMDKGFINTNKPAEVNRVRLSDDGRAVIFGSNFRLPDEALKNLKDNYGFEDYSKPEGDVTTSSGNSNSNVNTR